MHPEGRKLLVNEQIQAKIESLETDVLCASVCSISKTFKDMTVLSVLIGTLEGNPLLDSTAFKKHIPSIIRTLKEEFPDYAIRTLSGKVIAIRDFNMEDIPNIKLVKSVSVIDEEKGLEQSVLISSISNQQVSMVGEIGLVDQEDSLNNIEDAL